MNLTVTLTMAVFCMGGTVGAKGEGNGWNVSVLGVPEVRVHPITRRTKPILSHIILDGFASDMVVSLILLALRWLTARVTCGWAGVDKTPRAGFCSGVENARKWRRIPPVKCTLCCAAAAFRD